MTSLDVPNQSINATPLCVTVHRGDHIESRHDVHAVVADRSGVISSWGDAERLTMPRSAIKSTQLLPLLLTGAAEAFAVTDDELALAASSHSGEPDHVERVLAWLDRLDRTTEDLECGAANPISRDAADDLRRHGQEPGAVHNCCSGKHSGFLTLAKHLGVDHQGYLHPDHAVQRQVSSAIEAMSGISLAGQQPVIDGCGIPVWRLPVSTLATTMARLVDPVDLPADLSAATSRVVQALPTRHWLVSGTGRAETVLADAATEPVIMKGGAEGVFMASVVNRGLGVAMKAEDGNGRAVERALSGLLHHLGVIPEPIDVNGPLRNAAGTAVGNLRMTVPA